MDTQSYITTKLETEIAELLGGKTLEPEEAPELPANLQEKLSASAVESFNALRQRLVDGSFPDLQDFHPHWGHDTGQMPNVAEDAFALANDGAGNYWLLCSDGSVESWCHDEGGGMEDHNSFESLDEAFACFVRITAVKRETVTLESVREVFESKSDSDSVGWEHFLEELEEYVEDL